MNSTTTFSGIQENTVHTHPSSQEVECYLPPAFQDTGKTNILRNTSRQPLQPLSAAERKARSKLKQDVNQKEMT